MDGGTARSSRKPTSANTRSNELKQRDRSNSSDRDSVTGSSVAPPLPTGPPPVPPRKTGISPGARKQVFYDTLD